MGRATRQEPKETRSGLAGSRVRISLAGNSGSAGGHRRSPSRVTSYSDREPGARPSDADQGEVVSVDAEGRFPVVEHLHLARGVGLDPDGGVPLPYVAKDRTQDELSHALGRLPHSSSG
ncbi:MAG TPA: hypothetical protein VH391_03030 [Solirubrobacterales bacterium]|jgi:hypothetical protein